MRIVFLPSAIEDLIWFKRYYERVFTAGALPARAAYARVLGLLRDNPLIGKPVQDRLGLREIAIPRTPFSLIYKVSPENFLLSVFGTKGETEGSTKTFLLIPTFPPSPNPTWR